MSYIIKGPNGHEWQGANWIFYNMSEYLLPALQSIEGAEAFVEKFEDALETQTGYINLDSLLSEPKASRIWLRAIDEVIANIRAEGNSDWKKPEMFEPYIQRISELKNLAINEYFLTKDLS